MKVIQSYEEYEFTQDELFAATRLSEPLKMLIRTLIAQEVRQRSQLTVDLRTKTSSEAVVAFIQQEAEKTGSIAAYNHLLVLSDTIEPPTPEEATQTADTSKAQRTPL